MMKRITFFVLKGLRYGLLALVTLLALAVLILLEENQRGKWAWEKYKREAEARGVSFDPRQFIPPPVPDDQNFAMTPLLKPLFGADADYKTKLAKRLELTSPRAGAMVPKFGEIWDGKRTDLGKWSEYLGEQDILHALKRFAPELDEVSTALRRPFARFPVHYEDGIETRIPHLTPLMNLSKLYRLRALAALDVGQAEQALADVESIFGLAESLRDEPLLASQITRETLLAIGSRVVWEGLNAHRWPEGELAQLQGRLEHIEFLTDFARSVRFERASDPAAMRQFLEAEPFRGFAPRSRASEWPWMRECWRLFLKTRLHQAMLASASFDEAYVLPVIDPTTHRVDVAKASAGQQRVDSMHGTFSVFSLFKSRGMVCMCGTPMFEFPQFAEIARTQATIDQALIACALERYRLAHGAFPDTLDALVPQYLAKVPHDIINGQPLHYRRTDDGLFLFYSVGWNETDDNGVVGMDAHHFPDIKEGDWVWRYPTPE